MLLLVFKQCVSINKCNSFFLKKHINIQLESRFPQLHFKDTRDTYSNNSLFLISKFRKNNLPYFYIKHINLLLTPGIFLNIFNLTNKSIIRSVKIYKHISSLIDSFYSNKYNVLFNNFNLRILLFTFLKKINLVFFRKKFFVKYYKHRRVKRWVRRSYIRLEQKSNFFFK